jgi:hypothetical protein
MMAVRSFGHSVGSLVPLKDFEARRRAEREFNRAYRAELIRQLKAIVAQRPEGYAPSDQDLEAGLPENVAQTVRLSGNPAMADAYLAAWELALETARTLEALEEPLTDGACELWYEARDAKAAAWEQFERLNAQVEACLLRDGK